MLCRRNGCSLPLFMRISETKRNVLFNYMGTGITIAVPLLALPWYISLLGMKNWGLISFIWLLQSLLGILNAGIGQVLISKFSKLAHQNHAQREVAELFFGFEKLYWAVSVVIGVVLIALSEKIAAVWLQPAGVALTDGQKVICAAGLIFMLKFPVSVYQSALFGLGLQGSYNIASSALMLFRHAVAVLLLLVWTNIETYLIWIVVSFSLESIVLAYMAWQRVGVRYFTFRWQFKKVKAVLIVSLGFSLAVIIGMLTLQLDKLMISWMLPIEQLGYYAIASAVGIGVIQIADPITRSVLPTISRLQSDSVSLMAFNFKVLAMMAAIICMVGITYAAVGEWFLRLWLKDAHLVDVIMPVLTVLLCGSAMNTMYLVGNMNWVASGQSSRFLMINTLGLIIAVMLTPIMIEHYSLVGAAFPWVALNFIGLLLGFDWIRKGEV